MAEDLCIVLISQPKRMIHTSACAAPSAAIAHAP
jgi:hypothetical protein